MRNSVIFLVICSVIGCAIAIGMRQAAGKPSSHRSAIASQQNSRVPHIGRIEVLNGCGISDAANVVADFLRDKGFDVKNIANASAWNYPFTIVISRTSDMTIAKQVCLTLHTNKMIMLKTNEEAYNVSVIIGPDFGEYIHDQ